MPAGGSVEFEMTAGHFAIGPSAAEIVSGDVSGGTNTSHTIVISALAALLDAVPPSAPQDDYEHAALQGNVLGKETEGARRRTFRYLKELYLLRPDALLFRALRDLWPDDPASRPLLAGLCALARDAVFRASSVAIVRSGPGDPLAARDLADAVGEHFSASYSAGTLAKIGRNTSPPGSRRVILPTRAVPRRSARRPPAGPPMSRTRFFWATQRACGAGLCSTRYGLACSITQHHT
jgi:hypothetical protein